VASAMRLVESGLAGVPKGARRLPEPGPRAVPEQRAPGGRKETGMILHESALSPQERRELRQFGLFLPSPRKGGKKVRNPGGKKVKKGTRGK